VSNAAWPFGLILLAGMGALHCRLGCRHPRFRSHDPDTGFNFSVASVPDERSGAAVDGCRNHVADEAGRHRRRHAFLFLIRALCRVSDMLSRVVRRPSERLSMCGPGRVRVKARVVKLRGGESRAAYAHLRYLQREGAALDGERGHLYSGRENQVDATAFLESAGGGAAGTQPMTSNQPLTTARRIQEKSTAAKPQWTLGSGKSAQK
jgi:hypothetical protein